MNSWIFQSIPEFTLNKIFHSQRNSLKSMYSVNFRIIHENLEIQKGEEMILVCTADVEALACVFRGPKSQSYSMIKGAK